MDFNKKLALVHAIPLLFAGIAAIYSYFNFASNGITSPSICAAMGLVAFFAFVLSYLICMTVFILRCT